MSAIRRNQSPARCDSGRLLRHLTTSAGFFLTPDKKKVQSIAAVDAGPETCLYIKTLFESYCINVHQRCVYRLYLFYCIFILPGICH